MDNLYFKLNNNLEALGLIEIKNSCSDSFLACLLNASVHFESLSLQSPVQTFFFHGFLNLHNLNADLSGPSNSNVSAKL